MVGTVAIAVPWWLLGQTVAADQIIGAAVLLTGLVAVNLGGRPQATASVDQVEGGDDDAVGIDPMISVDLVEGPGLTKMTDS